MELSLPESVAMLKAAVSVRAPPSTCTVSKPFSVSNSENCGRVQSKEVQVAQAAESATRAYLQHNTVAFGRLERPLAVGEGRVALWKAGALDEGADGRFVVATKLGTVQLVREVAAVVLFVASEGRVDAASVRAEVRACKQRVSKAWCTGKEVKRDWSPCGQAGERQMKGISDSQVDSSHDCSLARPVEACTHLPSFVLGCPSAQKPENAAEK